MDLDNTQQVGGDRHLGRTVAPHSPAQLLPNNLAAGDQRRPALKLGLSRNYLRCFKSCLTLAPALGLEQVRGLLELLVDKLHQGHCHARHYGDLLDLIRVLFTNETPIERSSEMVQWRALRQLLDLLRRDEHRLEAARWILESMRASARLSRPSSSGPPLDGGGGARLALLGLFATINNSLGPLAPADERHQLTELILFHLNSIDLSQETAEEQLEFYSKCRTALGNLDSILVQLCWLALGELPRKQRKLDRRRQARHNFLNACLTFAFVTIPAICSEPSETMLATWAKSSQNHESGADDQDDSRRLAAEQLARLRAILPSTSSSSSGPSGSGRTTSGKLAVMLALYIEGARLALTHFSLSMGDFYLKQSVSTLGQLVDLALEPSQLEGGVERANSWPAGGLLFKTVLGPFNALLDLVLEQQDHIDLKHKLALGKLASKWARASKQTSEQRQLEDNDEAQENFKLTAKVGQIYGCNLDQETRETNEEPI